MPGSPSPITPDIEARLQTLRNSKGLRPVSEEEEGSPLGRLPELVYGFTYSPLNESTPLFAARTLQSFEVHKVTAGVAHVLGFVTPVEAEAIKAGQEAVDCHLYPEPRGESSELVEIPFERIVKAQPVSRGDGNYMPVHLDSAS